MLELPCRQINPVILLGQALKESEVSWLDGYK